ADVAAVVMADIDVMLKQFFFFSSRRRHTRCLSDWSSDVCSSDLNFRKLDQEFALTNRFRTEVTDNLLAAARTIGTRRFIAQSYCGWPYAKKGGPVKTEEDPLDPKPPESFTKTLAGIRYLEDKIRSVSYLEAFALRYGWFYGPGTGFGKGGQVY